MVRSVRMGASPEPVSPEQKVNLSKQPPEIDPEPRPKRTRRLKPDAAERIARFRGERLNELYVKPVESLQPEELARMKAAFFRS